MKELILFPQDSYLYIPTTHSPMRMRRRRFEVYRGVLVISLNQPSRSCRNKNGSGPSYLCRGGPHRKTRPLASAFSSAFPGGFISLR